jgi:hypothetical protein
MNGVTSNASSFFFNLDPTATNTNTYVLMKHQAVINNRLDIGVTYGRHTIENFLSVYHNVLAVERERE